MKKARLLFLAVIVLLVSCHFGSKDDQTNKDTTFKTIKEIDTVKVMKQDTCIPEKKVDNSVPE